jgi:autotransporter-associated beta strand protein
VLVLGALGLAAAHADPLWTGSADTNFSNPANWIQGIPGAGTVVQFGASNVTQLSISSPSAAVQGIVFGAQAPAYSLSLQSNGAPAQSLTIGAAGIVNQSAALQTFVAGTLNSAIVLTGAGAQIVGNVAINNVGLLANTTFNSGASAGSAAIQNQAGGTSVFNAASAGSARITVGAASGLSFLAGSTGASSQITNLTGGTTSFNDSSGAGSATLTNQGSLVFAGTSSAGLSQISNSATLLFGNQATAGASRISNAAQGVLQFTDQSQGGQAVIANLPGGSILFTGSAGAPAARITNSAGASVDVSGSAVGTVSIGSLSGAGLILLGPTSLTLGAANLNDTISGVISGTSGQLVKVGSANLVLTGANTYGGTTSVTGGGLEIDGSIAGDLGIASGAQASGTGLVGGTLTVGTGGTVRSAVPGAGLNVKGSVLFEPQSTFATTITAAGAAGSLSSTGSLRLSGADLALNLSGNVAAYAPGSTYTLMRAQGGVLGQFSLVENPLTSLVAMLRYAPESVELVLEPARLTGLGPQSPPNQSSTAGALAGVGALVGPLSSLPASALGSALEGLNASPYSALRRSALLDGGQFAREVAERSQLALTADEDTQLHSGWLDLVGATSHTPGNSNAVGYRTQAQGLIGGVKLIALDDLTLGAAGELVRSRFGFDSQIASGQSDTTQVGFILNQRLDPFVLSVVADYRSETDVMNRSILLPGLMRGATGHTELPGWSTLVRLDWPQQNNGLVPSPYAAIQWTGIDSGGFDERGAGPANLVGASSNLGLTVTSLGLRDTGPLRIPGLANPLQLDASLAWLHQIGALNPQVMAHFESSPSLLEFVSSGAALPSDSALLFAGVRYDLSRSLAIEGRVSAQGNGTLHDEYAYLGLRYLW